MLGPVFAPPGVSAVSWVRTGAGLLGSGVAGRLATGGGWPASPQENWACVQENWAHWMHEPSPHLVQVGISSHVQLGHVVVWM